MKRTKIMLAAIAVLAIAGSVVAFKVKRFGNMSYCYTYDLHGASCPLVLVNATMSTTVNHVEWVKYTTTFNTNLCPLVPAEKCTGIGKWGGL